MNNACSKNIFIVIFSLFIFCCNCCYSKSFDFIALNTAPVTLSPEELSENNTTKQVEKSLPVEIKPIKIETKTNNNPVKNLNYKNSVPEKVKNTVSVTSTEQNNKTKKNAVKTVKSLEVLDFDVEDNVFRNKDSESFLLVPIDKEQLESENQQYKIEDLSSSLIKDAPKTLNTKTKIASRIYAHFIEKSGQKYTVKTKKEIIISIIVRLIVFALIILFGFLGYVFYNQRKKAIIEMERIKNLSYEEIKRHELIQAIEEFEQTEESHKKLGQKIYINELEKYKSLDGFKKDEVADDVINTMETIEKAQKNETPLTLKDKQVRGFKKNNYAFENDIGILSDEEGIALFDEDTENDKFLSEEEFLNPDYYSENSEIFNNNEQLNDDIFIIEDENEDEEKEYSIIEEKPQENQNANNSEQTSLYENTKEQVKNNEQSNKDEDKKNIEKKTEEPKLEIQERYPLDDNRGFALLSYKKTIALIGYIGENITVLKRFSQKDEAKNLSVRIYEELSDNNVQYMVRVGKFKGIVELNADTIKLIMNL